MGASRIQVWQYITAILLIIFLTGHLIERLPWLVGAESYHDTLKSTFAEKQYSSWWSIGLLTLAYIALFHGLNGVRGILHEWAPRLGTVWDVTILILFIIFAAIATQTVVVLWG
jgi:succinate dehydrogenase / fumarate reductase membrane anchor subunit